MMRSLFAGISGLKNHQTRMDVVGNNIANVNTIGFKSGRLNFEDAMSQTLAGATAPGQSGQGEGGTNPMQVGLGTGVGAIDTLFSQGNMQRTGQTTDLAIQGSAFFQVSDGKAQYYTRNGAFSLDAAGHLVMPANGMVLQGLNATEAGVIGPSAVVEDIQVPFNTQSPAQATTEINIGRNLNADSFAKGTVTSTPRFLTAATDTQDLRAVFDSKGQDLSIHTGDTIKFSAIGAAGTEVVDSYKVVDGDTLATLNTRLQTFLRSQAGSTGATVVMNADGTTTMSAIGGPIRGLQVTSDRSSSTLINAYSVNATIPAGSSDNTQAFRKPVSESTLLADVYDAKGNSLGLEAGDEISISGAVGGTADPKRTLTYDPATTTMQDLLDNLRDQLKLPLTDGTSQANPTISINESVSDDEMQDGSIVVRGIPGKVFSLSDLSISANNSNSTTPLPANFNANLRFSEFQAASDTQIATTSITTYDDKGFAHNVSVTFTPTATPGEWMWEASMSNNEIILGGKQGKVSFGADGTVSNFSFEDASGAFRVDPGTGAQVMEISLNPGGPGKYAGLTQFKAATTAAATDQNGYTMGKLRSIAIGADGLITGAFDNGESQTLGQVMVADFTNPGGLMAASDSVFKETSNSGAAILGRPGKGSTSTLDAGALEMSNVDLAGEFTEMITTQRGYQANARVISTSDKFLEELVNLAR